MDSGFVPSVVWQMKYTIRFIMLCGVLFLATYYGVSEGIRVGLREAFVVEGLK